MALYRRFEVHHHGDVAEIRFVDSELSDLEIHDQLTGELVSFAEAETPSKVVVNMAAVKYCTSGAIGGLLSLRKVVTEHGGVVRVCEASTGVRMTFQSLNLDGTLFKVDESLEDALGQF